MLLHQYINDPYHPASHGLSPASVFQTGFSTILITTTSSSPVPSSRASSAVCDIPRLGIEESSHPFILESTRSDWARLLRRDQQFRTWSTLVLARY